MATVDIHKSGEQGIFSNAYIVDTGHSLVVVDGTLTVSEARAFGALLKSMTKPLKAILITHAHPDHVAGITEWLPSADIPIYSVRSVEQLMRATEEQKRAQWGPVFKEEWVQKWTYPNRIVRDGEAIHVDGLSFRVHELGPGGRLRCKLHLGLGDGSTHCVCGRFDLQWHAFLSRRWPHK